LTVEAGLAEVEVTGLAVTPRQAELGCIECPAQKGLQDGFDLAAHLGHHAHTIPAQQPFEQL
jgi:hypothetical protein